MHLGVPQHIKERAEEKAEIMIDKMKIKLKSEIQKARKEEEVLLFGEDIFDGTDVFDDDIDEDVDGLIGDADVKEELLEEILLSIFSGNSINEEEILSKYVSLLLKEKEY